MTLDRDRLMDVLDRAHQGPISTDRDYNVVRIPEAVGKYTEKYGLAGAYDPDNPVNVDNELADRFR